MKIIIKTSLPGATSAELKGLISRGIKAVELDGNDHLILTLSDNTSHDLGSVRGTGVDSVEQTAASQEDGGDNVFTFTLTDGSTAQFTVKNGSKGSQGLKGDTGDTGPQGPAGAGSPADSLPIMDGTATVGTEMSFARGDHIHPTDTSRMAANATPTPAAHAGSHATGGADAITPTSIGAADASHTHSPAGIGAEKERLEFHSTSVPVASFVADTTYEEEGFSYRAAIPLTGVLESMTPDVIPSCAVIMSGNLAPVGACYDGGIYIYAVEVPEAAIVIDTIICWKAVG